jgi:Fe(3+) dicitrate transport protein
MDEMNTRHRQYSIHYVVNPTSGLFFQVTGYTNTFSRNWYKLDKVQNEKGDRVSIGRLLNDHASFPDAYEVLTGRSTIGSESLIVKANNRSYISEGIQAKANYEKGNHQIEMGIRIHRDEMDRFQWVDGYSLEEGTMELETAGVKGTESNRIESASAIASYVNYTNTFGAVKLNVGLRMEDISISREDFGKEDPDRKGVNLNSRTNEVNALIPGIGLMYELDQGNQLFGGIHRGFSPPGSSPETNAESSVNYELGYRMMNDRTYASLVLFMNDYDNLLGVDFASSGGLGSGDQFNGGNAMAKGIEIAFSSRKPITDKIWIPIELQYTFTDARFNNSFESDFDAWGQVEDGDRLPYIAPHVWSLTSGFKSGNWAITGSVNFMGEMRIVAGQGPTTDREVINERLLLSVNANYSLTANTNLSLGIHNLTNRVYSVATRPAGWRPGAPRNIVLGLEARF